MLSAFAGQTAEHQRMFSHLTTSRESEINAVFPSYSKKECGLGSFNFLVFTYLISDFRLYTSVT